MVTRNFKNILGVMLQAYNYSNPNANGQGMLEAANVSGNTRYIINYGGSGFPSATTSPTLATAAAGISVGTSNAAASENDYNLGATITSGIALQTTQITQGMDNGNPYIEFKITATNNTNAAITISEIGYKQSHPARSEQGTGGIYYSNEVFLLDRTVLESPLTVAPGASGVINYRLTTQLAAQS